MFLHEVLHAVYDVSGLNRMDNLPEEVVVNMLGYQLLQVIRDNPHLTAYLGQAFKETS